MAARVGRVSFLLYSMLNVSVLVLVASMLMLGLGLACLVSEAPVCSLHELCCELLLPSLPSSAEPRPEVEEESRPA